MLPYNTHNYTDQGNGKLALVSIHTQQTCMILNNSASKIRFYLPHFYYFSQLGLLYSCRPRKWKIHITFIYFVHVYTCKHEKCKSICRNRKTRITSHGSKELQHKPSHADPGNGKLTLLYIVHYTVRTVFRDYTFFLTLLPPLCKHF